MGEDFGGPGFTISAIWEGYKIPFIDIPPPKHCLNNGSALREKEFVSEAISDLVKNKLCRGSECAPAYVNSLSVSVQASGKKRLI